MSAALIGGLAVDIAGDGDAVILVHGLGGSSNTFQPLLGALQGKRAIRPDLPGAGRSPVPDGALSMQAFAQAILRVADDLNVSRAHLVGHSMGTIVCQHIAAERPDFVRSLLLFGPLIEASEAMRTGLGNRAKLARTEGMAPIADQIIAGGLSPQTKASRPAAVAFVRESLMRQDPEGYARHCEALGGAKAANHARITAPTLLLTGDADATAAPATAKALAERIAGARVDIIGECGHWATLERPEVCADKLAAFYGGLA
jgi:pimeloyl-ACP methyl ester carboxylesterase